jgi:hypothetical protein
MGLITERDSAVSGYASVTLPGAPSVGGAPDSENASSSPGAPGSAGDEAGTTVGASLHRRSALPSRRSVLYLLCQQDAFVEEDLVTWYTERGFHFYIADLRQPAQPDGQGRGGPRQAECFARLDAAAQQLRDDGIEMIIVSGHSAGALIAALWCDTRRDTGVADALILSCPAFGRRLRHGLDITCPVLVLSREPQGRAGRLALSARRRDRTRDRARDRTRERARERTVRLGPHVTWLRLDSGPDGEMPAPDTGPPPSGRRVFDELGRWLGAYMYGQARDQLL